MDIPDPWSWIIIGVFVLLHFFFSMSETALSCCNRFKMQILADEGNKSAKLIIKLLNRFDRTLTAVLIGINIVSILISMISTMCFLRYFNNVFNDFTISFISSFFMSLLIYIFGDALPKSIARSIPDTISLKVSYIIYAISWFFTYIIPIAILFELLVKLFEKTIKIKSNDNEFTEDDFENSVEKSLTEGSLYEEQADIIQSALEFGDTSVKQIITKKENMFSLNLIGLTHEKLQNILLNTSYSRIPVYENDENNIVGVINVNQYFKCVEFNPSIAIRKILNKPYYVNSNIKLDDLFNGFKKHHTHIAFVKNNDKILIGMVTMEDVLEEIVDDIDEKTSFKERKLI